METLIYIAVNDILQDKINLLFYILGKIALKKYYVSYFCGVQSGLQECVKPPKPTQDMPLRSLDKSIESKS